MKFRLLTALWGAEFCDIFLRVTARSLLAAGNFPDLSRRHDATYTIITTAADAARIAPHPVFRALAAAGKVELQTIDEGEIDPTNPSSHWIIWRKGIEAAKEKRESVIYIMPDVVYASGTLLGWASAFEQGYRAVFSSVPEVVLETTLRELDERPAVAQRAELNLSVRELTNLFLKHIHPYHLCMLRSGRRWIAHPEFVSHVVRDAGFVQRIMGSHPFCFDPEFFKFNDAYVPLDHLDRIAFLPCTAISLEPFLKFMPHYYRPWTVTEDRLSSFAWWFDHYASDANDLESSHSYVFPLPGAGRRSAAFAGVHAGGDFYRTQCLAARAIFRVWEELGKLGCDRAAELLATAHYAGRLRRSMPLRTPMTVLVPSNAAIQRAGLHCEDGGGAERRRALSRRVRDHCFSGDHRFGVGQRIVTNSEGQVSKAWRIFGNVRNAGKILAGPIDLGGMLIYVTDFIAAPRAMQSKGDRAGRGERMRGPSAPAADRLKSLLVHPSLVDESDGAKGEPPVKPAAMGVEASAHCRQAAEQLGKLIKEYVAAEPATPPRAVSETVAEGVSSARVGPIQSLLVAMRTLPGPQAVTGVVRRSISAFKVQQTKDEPPPPDVPAVKGAVREHLLADRMEEANAAAGGLVQVWCELAGDLVAQGHVDLGLYCRRTALELNPSLRQNLVRELLLAGRQEEANSADGGQLELWRALGGDLAAQGHPEPALYCRRRAIEFDPVNSQLHKELVRELLLIDRLEEAKRAASSVPHVWRDLGQELEAQGYPDLAQYCRQQARESKRVEDASIKRLHNIQVNIGLLALQEILAGYAAAIGVTERCHLESSPGPLACLDQYLAASNESLDPLMQLTRLLEREPDFAEAWIEKAFCHWEAGQVVPAIEAALRAAGARPRCIRREYNPHPHAEAAELVARCLELAGLNEDAIKAYRKSLSFDKGQRFMRVCLGQLLWKQGRVEDAMREFTMGMTFGYRLANLPNLPRRLEEMSLNLD
jgi:tetratricopeptide (TPR) repeat protein